MCRQHQTVLLDWDLCASSSIPFLTGAKPLWTNLNSRAVLKCLIKIHPPAWAQGTRVPWWLWTLLLLEQGGGGLERQCSSEFFCLSQTFLLSEKRQWALLWLSYSFSRAVTQIQQSLDYVRKFIFTHEKQGYVKSDLARREVKSVWKGQIKQECHCHSLTEMKLTFFFNICHLCGCDSFNVYTAKIAQLKCLMTAFFQQRAL